MSYTTSQLLPFNRDTVWDYHTHSGAVARLTPPFLPMTPVRIAASLADGTTVFALPAGLKWVARHDITAYHRGYQFADECVSAPVKSLANWRHIHRFEDTDGGTTVTDSVATKLPDRALRAAFAYRQRQLFGDLTSASRINPRPMTVAITGSRGLVGRALSAYLTTLGVTVIQMVRGRVKPGQRHWDPASPSPQLLDGIDALIHLAGEPILGRFNTSHKNELRSSRIEPTRLLAELVSASPTCHSFISASAIGYYGPVCGENEPSDTNSPAGKGFLAELTRDWEAAALSCTKRTVVMRTGIVISGRGGVLPVFKALFSTGLGGTVGTGEQWMSWISIDDLIDAYAQALFSGASGPVNAVAATPVTNAEFTDTLASELRRPAIIGIPTLGPKLLLGREAATEFALADQRVASSHTQLRFPTLKEALAHELGTA